MGVDLPLSLVCLEDDRRIVAAEPKRVQQGDPDRPLVPPLRDAGKSAVGIWIVVVEGGMN